MKLNDPITIRTFEIEHKYGTFGGRVEYPPFSRCEEDSVDIFIDTYYISPNYVELRNKLYELLPYGNEEGTWLGKFPSIPTDDILVELVLRNKGIDPEKYTNNN